MTGALDPVRHARLVLDADRLCADAGVPRHMLDRHVGEFLAPAEVEWLRAYPENRRAGRGLVLSGRHEPPPDVKMQAMAAALMRNFVDARLATVAALVRGDGDPPDPTVLLVPNLYVRQGGRGMPAWQSQLLYDALLSRSAAGRLTVAYVEDDAAMEQEHGRALAQHLARYARSGGGK